MSRAWERKKATELKAADAREVIKAALPFALQHMTSAQVDQVQRVLDSYVVNPWVRNEEAEIRRKAVKAESGGYANIDEDDVNRRVNPVRQQFMIIQEADKHVRLNFAMLLAPDALKPATDNPDEAAYLLQLYSALASRGIWLRCDVRAIPGSVRNTNPPQGASDPRSYGAWLSLGVNGETFETQTGRLDRRILLGLPLLAAGYFGWVLEGSTAKLLTKAMDKLSLQIIKGHQEFLTWRPTSGVSVSRISNALGGADYPDERIWTAAQNALVQAMHLKASGHYKDAAKLTIIAAMQTAAAAEVLANYIAATRAGAARAVKILSVLAFAGKVAEAILLIYGLVVGLTRLLSMRTAAAAADGAAGAGGRAGAGAVGETGPRPVTHQPLRDNPTNMEWEHARNSTIEQANRTLNSGEIVAETEVVGPRAVRAEQIYREFRDWLRANPNASLAEKLARLERWNQLEYGTWFPNR